MSTRTLLPVCALVVALALPGSAVAKLPSFPSNVIEPGKSIAGIKLFASPKAAKKAWGAGKACSTNDGNVYCSWQDGKNGSANWSAVEGKVTDVSINAGYKGTTPYFGGPLAQLKTSKGIGIGSTFKAAKAAYPKGKVTDTVLQVPGKGKAFTTFVASKGKVTAIVVGDGLHQG